MNTLKLQFGIQPQLSVVLLQKWENALEEHIAYSRHYTRVGDESNDELEDVIPLGSMGESLQVSIKRTKS